MDRERVMKEAIHSGEMEGAYVSAEFREDADEELLVALGLLLIL